MATPTSSSNRSKRKGTKPITQGQNPQRGNRQKVSNAQVTNSNTRGSNTGSAKVTTGRGASKPVPKALPPGTKGGPLATQGRTPLKGQPQLPPGRKGGSVEKAGPTVDVKANSAKLPTSRNGGAITRSSSGVLARVGKTASSAVKNAGTAGRALTGLKGGLVAAALSAGGSAAIDAVTNAYKQAIRKERGQRAAESGQSGRYVPGSQQVRPPAPKPQAKPQNNQPRNFRQEQQASQSQPQRRGSGSMPSAVTRSMSGSGGGGSSAAKPAMPGRKWEDFNPGRGTSKSNNPLLDSEKGGFKLRDRMKNREATDQANKAKSMVSNFGQDSGYQPQTKVDGSKYADKKPDMKKVNEYDRRKRRYYD